jgi:hypothetical protein
VIGMESGNDIREFLTSRRAKITPEQSGLPDHGGVYVTEGIGYVQSRGGDVITIRPDDVVYTPPGEEHRHGAASNHFMTHLALWERDDTTWAVHRVVATLGAQMSMGDSWRIGADKNERTGLVTGGAFGLAPNPIFSAMLLTAVGLASMVPNVLASVGSAALVVALELQVRGVEEPYLHTVHGETYAASRLRVGRFIPRVGRP